MIVHCINQVAKDIYVTTEGSARKRIKIHLRESELRKLIEFISRSDFNEFEMEQEGFRLRLSRGVPAIAPAPAVSPAAAVTAPAAVEAPAQAQSTPAASADASDSAASGLVEIRSPIVGTFYRSPSPEASSFVEVGDKIEVGQVLCIVEAMKLMNEIEADKAGVISAILVENGEPVEFGQALFEISPS